MTMTKPTDDEPRTRELPRRAAMRLAATEYQRVIEVLGRLEANDWTIQTDCPAWDVRAMATHLLAMTEMAASIREQSRQMTAAAKRGGVFIDALTALQVEEGAHLRPDEIVSRFTRAAPRAARRRRWTPALVRRRTLPYHQMVNGREENWTIGYLVDVILTRDPWMHRIDITRATRATHVLTAEHDGVLVDDVVNEWAQRHGRPFSLRLTGAAGGTWARGTCGSQLELDATDFCRAVSHRRPADGLLATEVPF